MQSSLQTTFLSVTSNVQGTLLWLKSLKHYNRAYRQQTAMHALLLSIVLLFLSSFSLMAQPAVEWDKVYSLPPEFNLEGGFARPTPDGGAIMGFRSNSGTRGYFINKFDQNGTKQWEKNYAGDKYDGISEIIPTSDGGYLLGGMSDSGVGGDKTEPAVGVYDYWIVKITSDGTKQWDKTFGGVELDYITSMKQTADGGYILGGSSSSPANRVKSENSIGIDYWVIKISATGIKQWDKTIRVTGEDRLTYVDQTVDGGYILGGYSYSEAGNDKTAPLKGYSDYWIVRLSANGTKLWDKSYGGYSSEEDVRLQRTTDGGYILAGQSESAIGGDRSAASFGYQDFWVVKINSDGQKQWDKAFGGTSGDYVTTLAPTANDGYLIGGYSFSEVSGNKTDPSKSIKDYWVVKIEADGGKIWDKSIGGNNMSRSDLGGAFQAPDGGYTLWGLNNSASIGGDKTQTGAGIWIVKLAPEQPSLPQTPIRINAGGVAFTTATKKLFIADQYYTGIDRTSSIASGDILNTSNDELYRSARCSPSFSYNIPVANGTVDVTLHFAETYFGAPGKKGGKGSRQFHVNLEGSRKLTNFDIFAAAGGAMHAYQTTIPVAVTDGMLNIDFLTGAADLPRISAIEVITTSSTLKPLADAYVRDGSYNATNYGTFTNLDVKNNASDASARRSSYLRFQLPAAVAVTAAKLRIYGHNHENSKSVSVHAYGVDNDSWTETGIVKTNAPAASTSSLGYAAVNNTYKYYEIDVTSYVKTQQQSGETLVSLLLADPNNRNIRLVFNSKEEGSYPPQLIVQVQTSPVVNSNTRLGNEEISTNLEAEPESSSVYPNPVGKQFTVQVSSKHSQDISFDLLNSSGQNYQIVAEEKVRAGQKAEVDISGLSLSSGIYMLKIKSAAATEVIKVLVTE